MTASADTFEASTQGWALHKRDASFSLAAARADGCISNPDFRTSGADVITCHQHQQVFYFGVLTLCFQALLPAFHQFIGRLQTLPVPACVRNLHASADTRVVKCTFAPFHNVS